MRLSVLTASRSITTGVPGASLTTFRQSPEAADATCAATWFRGIKKVNVAVRANTILFIPGNASMLRRMAHGRGPSADDKQFR
jgi:hypothetical protein